MEKECINYKCFGDKVSLNCGTPICIETLEKFILLHGADHLLPSWFPLIDNGCCLKSRIKELNEKYAKRGKKR